MVNIRFKPVPEHRALPAPAANQEHPAPQGERDTLFYYQPEELIPEERPGLTNVDDEGILFTADSHTVTLKEVQFAYSPTLESHLPRSREYLIKTAPNDSIPGSVIDSFTVTIRDSTDLYPHWVRKRFPADSGIVVTEGQFWIVSPGFLTVHDTTSPISGHVHFEEWVGWEQQEWIDYGIRAIVERTPTHISDRPRITPPIRLFPTNHNPFNSRTRIAFQIPRRSRVTLQVYDVKGL